MAKPEKFLIENYSLGDVFKEEFMQKIKGIDSSIFPTSIVFIVEKEDDGMKSIAPLIFSHQTNQEVEQKRLHIESPDTVLIEKAIKEFEEENGAE